MSVNYSPNRSERDERKNVISSGQRQKFALLPITSDDLELQSHNNGNVDFLSFCHILNKKDRRLNVVLY